MPITTLPQVKDPLPEGATATPGTCPTCSCTELRIIEREHNATRSAEPMADGRYEIHPHFDWCPVLSGVTPEVACLECGAPVWDIGHSPGVVLTMPNAGPYGRDDHWVGSRDDPGYRQNGRWATNEKAAPDFDKVTVGPCGHVHEGPRAHEQMAVMSRFLQAQAEREATDEFARHEGLTAAVEAAGMGVLVERWRHAVRTGSVEAVGLLAAIRVVGDVT